MAIIKCLECGKDISDQAKECPNCGCPLEKHLLCEECGTRIEKGEKFCSNCGCPTKGKNLKNSIIKKESISKLMKNRSLLLVCGLVLIAFIFIIVIVSKENKLVCSYSNSNNVGAIESKVTYEFKNGKVKKLTGYQYAKPSDKEVAEGLWKVTNKDQDQYNYYDGLSYKATFSENNEIVINYSIDAEKAPTMFKSMSSLSGVNGVTSSLSKVEIQSIYEDSDFICK